MTLHQLNLPVLSRFSGFCFFVFSSEKHLFLLGVLFIIDMNMNMLFNKSTYVHSYSSRVILCLSEVLHEQGSLYQVAQQSTESFLHVLESLLISTPTFSLGPGS